MWYRVFGLLSEEISPVALAEHLHATGLPVEPHFRGDELGWTAGELRLTGLNSPVLLDRYLAAEDDIRDCLNAYAAELETRDYSENSAPLMQRVIQTQQLIVIRKPVDAVDEIVLEKLLFAVCRFLASHTDGVIQVDDQGWFTPEGTLLVQEY